MGNNGWPLKKSDDFPGAQDDPYNNAEHIKDIYLKVDPEYAGRFTVPVLWDRKNSTIVSNESSEIIRMLNTEFNDIAPNELDLYPEDLRKDIDELNAWVYDTVNSTSFDR